MRRPGFRSSPATKSMNNLLSSMDGLFKAQVQPDFDVSPSIPVHLGQLLGSTVILPSTFKVPCRSPAIKVPTRSQGHLYRVLLESQNTFVLRNCIVRLFCSVLNIFLVFLN
ncbi:hypothetical protein RvY_17392-2 [Ramazzottius varieornatus]|uniref:Uncharacterized protein n=1 Tax=Ramazzottius varieornatus TaxID=947166 RepID=A0A1D1W1Y4_RAMVA|nr:hypothetical protein RvY_17392-2 [Ramazzottius varieornatus]